MPAAELPNIDGSKYTQWSVYTCLYVYIVLSTQRWRTIDTGRDKWCCHMLLRKHFDRIISNKYGWQLLVTFKHVNWHLALLGMLARASDARAQSQGTVATSAASQHVPRETHAVGTVLGGSLTCPGKSYLLSQITNKCMCNSKAKSKTICHNPSHLENTCVWSRR